MTNPSLSSAAATSSSAANSLSSKSTETSKICAGTIGTRDSAEFRRKEHASESLSKSMHSSCLQAALFWSAILYRPGRFEHLAARHGRNQLAHSLRSATHLVRGSPSTAFAARRTIFLFNKLFLFLINSDVAHAGFPAARSTLPLASRTRDRTLARRHLSEGSSDRILRLVKAQNTVSTLVPHCLVSNPAGF
jgi:hypothetical protein